MLKAVGFGLAFGAGVQAWRQWPPDGPVTTSSGAVVMVIAVVCAYLGGKWSGRGGSTAVAVATATAVAASESNASSVVNVAVVVPGAGAGSSTRMPEVLPWAVERPELQADDVDGADLDELIYAREEHEQY